MDPSSLFSHSTPTTTPLPSDAEEKEKTIGRSNSSDRRENEMEGVSGVSASVSASNSDSEGVLKMPLPALPDSFRPFLMSVAKEVENERAKIMRASKWTPLHKCEFPEYREYYGEPMSRLPLSSSLTLHRPNPNSSRCGGSAPPHLAVYTAVYGHRCCHPWGAHSGPHYCSMSTDVVGWMWMGVDGSWRIIISRNLICTISTLHRCICTVCFFQWWSCTRTPAAMCAERRKEHSLSSNMHVDTRPERK